MPRLHLCAALMAATPAWAQNAPATSPSTVVITGNPLARDTLAQPASVLGGDALLLRREGSLGDTLSGLPGVSATGFGPNASRPVIRGLDGDRIRLLDNGGASVDASNLSFDHATAIDPLVIERLEVLRGPAALLYGGNATGGVVNTLHNRIPRVPLDGLAGRAEMRLGTAARERAGAAVLDGGAGNFAWHVDAAGRSADDLRVPRYTPREDGLALDPATRVRNSASESRSGALGASWADADGYVGVSLDGLRHRYGVTVEPDVTIRMERERATFAGERRRLSGPFSQVEWSAGRTTYRHREIEGSGAVGTTFRSSGTELRMSGQHAPVGPLRGVLGVAAEDLKFSALGEEAFVPNTRTRSAALFALEEFDLGPLTLGAGARIERVRVSADVAATRRYSPTSTALSALWPLAREWSLSGSVGRTERAPAYYELHADGVHVATGTYERGDPTLAAERSAHAEAGLGWKRGAHAAKLSVYTTRFRNYIALADSGTTFDDVDEDGNPVSFPIYEFRAVPARLRGFEFEGRSRLVERPWTLDLAGSVDQVRAVRRDTGEPLPRIAPTRASVSLEAGRGPWRAGLGVRHAAAQHRVGANDVPTPSYTLLNLWLTHRMRIGTADALWFLRLDNVTDELAFNAVALRTARELSPLAGRSASAGVRVMF